MPTKHLTKIRVAISRIDRFVFHLPWSNKRLVLAVTLLLALTRFAIITLPFRYLEKLLGERLLESSVDEPVSHVAYARKVGWVIRIISHHTPWKSNCFPQALTAKILLRRRGIPSTLYMGAAFDHDSGAPTQLRAHAWLRCGQIYVTGGNGGERYATVAAFG